MDLGHCMTVVVKRLDESKTAGGIIIPDTAKKANGG